MSADQNPPSDATATPTPAPEGEAVAAPPEPAPEPAAVAPEPPTPEPPAPAEPDVSVMLSNKDVRAEINRQVRAAAKKAQEEERARAAQEAERAKLEEVERLKLEKADAEKLVAAAQREATEARRERDMANTLVGSSIALASPAALDFVRHEAFRACDSNEDLTMEDAIQRVIDTHPYLVAQPAPEAPPVAPQPTITPPQRPTTVAVTKATQAPAGAEPPAEVDVMALSPEEYRKYKRANHGLH